MDRRSARLSLPCLPTNLSPLPCPSSLSVALAESAEDPEPDLLAKGWAGRAVRGPPAGGLTDITPVSAPAGSWARSACSRTARDPRQVPRLMGRSSPHRGSRAATPQRIPARRLELSPAATAASAGKDAPGRLAPGGEAARRGQRWTAAPAQQAPNSSRAQQDSPPVSLGSSRISPSYSTGSDFFSRSASIEAGLGRQAGRLARCHFKLRS